MSFKEVTNQNYVINFLLSSYQNNRFTGCYLFIGKDGTGKAKVAREFAKLINCKNPNLDSCGQCRPCTDIENNKHPDVHWFLPINNSIVISQVRELEKYIYLKPYESKNKVFIICDAQYLTEESSNALLKTLEEPPKDSLIILIANDTKSLLATISSRCQKIVFNYFGEQAIKDILIHKYKIPLSHAHFISYLSEGSLGKAIDFKNLKDSLYEKRDHILNAVYFKKFSIFKMEEFNIEDNTQKRKSIQLLLDILLTWFRDLLIIKNKLELPLVNLDKKQELFNFSNKYTNQELINNISSISSTKFLINNNINVKLAISKLRVDLWK